MSAISTCHSTPLPGHRTQKANSLLSPLAQPLGYFYLPLSGDHKGGERQSLNQEVGIQSDRDRDEAVRYSGVETESQGASYMQEKDLHFQKERAKRPGKGASESPLWPTDFSSHALRKRE